MSPEDTHDVSCTDANQTSSFRAEPEELLGEPVDAETAAEVETGLDERVIDAADAVNELLREEAQRLVAENGGELA